MTNKIWIDNGTNVNPDWYGHIAVSYDGTNWTTLNKDGLSVKPRFKRMGITNPPGVAGKTSASQTMITLSDFSGSTLLEFECDQVQNQATWNGGTTAAQQVAVDDITTWIGELSSGSVTATVTGNVGGFTTKKQNTITTTNGTAYDAEDNVGGIITVASLLRTNGGTGVLHDLLFWSKANQKPNLIIDIWSASPSVGTYTNDATQVIEGDEDAWIGQYEVAVSDWEDTGVISTAHIKNLGGTLDGFAADDLYLTIKTKTAITYTSVDGLIIKAGALQD